MPLPSTYYSDLAREIVAACELIDESGPAGREPAESLPLERVKELVRSLGYGVHPVLRDGARPRAGEPAFRVETSADYVVHDVRRAAGVARSRARRAAVGLCTEEPLEEDPLGVLIDLMDLEVPLSDLHGVVESARLERTARTLTASER